MNYKLIALLSGLFIAVNIVFDSFNLQVIFSNMYNYAILGAWIAVILTFLIALFLGKKLDPKFKRIGFIPKGSIIYALLAGLFGAGYTLFMLYLLKIYDPAAVSALIPFTILFLVIRDIYFTKEKPNLFEISSFVMVIIGAILVSFKGGKFDLLVLLTAGVLLNILNAIYSHFMKLGMSKEGTDAFNFRLFITIVLAIAFTIYSWPHISFTGEKVLRLLPYVIGSMFFAFLGYITYLLALKEGKVSVVSSLNFSYIAFAFILTLSFSLFRPEVFSLEINGTFWIMRLLGTILIGTGILTLILSEFSTWLFIKCNLKNYNHIITELEKMNEVKSVYKLFGNYSLAIKLTVKSSGKLENTITHKIKSLKGIQDIVEARIMKNL